MKKHITKIVLAYSLLCAAGFVFVALEVIAGNMNWHDFEKMTLLALFALSGLFLCLYRIIDLMEKR